MLKRERLEQTLSGGNPDRVPVSLWRHWPGDDQRAADFARYTVGFQWAYDWDFIKLTPFSAYMTADYGLHTQWGSHVGADLFGDRTIVKRRIDRSLDWTEIRTLDPSRGELAKHLDAIRLLSDALANDPDPAPVMTTLYSPLTQAIQLAGVQNVLRDMRSAPDRLQSGLNVITESTLRFIAELRRLDVAGVYYVMDSARYDICSLDEYQAFAQPYDQKLWDSFPDKWWLNILSLSETLPMLDMAMKLHPPILHYDLNVDDLSRVRGQFDRVLCGGLTREQLHADSPTIGREAARSILDEMNRRRLILSASSAVYISTPRANLRVIREIVGE
jgi:uroporphyrinogen decarboxylase